MGLLDFNNPEVLNALRLLSAHKGELTPLLGQFAVEAEARKRSGLQEQEQRRLQEAHQFQMEQARRLQAEQEQIKGLGQRAFAPNQNLVQNDDEGYAMPSSGGGGLPEFAQGMMGIDPFKGIGLQQQIAAQNAPQYQKIGEGESLYNMRNPAQPVVQGPPKLPTGMRMGPNGPEYMPEYLAGQKAIRREGKTDVTTNVMAPREVFKDSLSLKKDFDAQPEVKGFKEVQSAWDQISGALKDPSAANDLAAATKFMKLLDPGSVVRESELAMAMQATGALDRFTNLGQRIMKGHKLTPEQRKDFYSAGEQLYTASKQRFAQTAEQYESIAKQYQLDNRFLPKAPAEEKAAPKLTIGGKQYEPKQAKDGKWYVKIGEKWHEVQQ